MARETAAEKRVRLEQERAERDARVWAEFTATYPVRFANVLFKYMELHYDRFYVKKLDDETYQFERDYTDETLKVTPPANYDWEYFNALDSVETAVREYYEEKQEAERKYAVRRAALAKLTAEEKELLGVE